jgi:hypothetical protein
MKITTCGECPMRDPGGCCVVVDTYVEADDTRCWNSEARDRIIARVLDAHRRAEKEEQG